MKIYLRNEGELKTFTHEVNLKACVTSRSTLKRMAKESSVNKKEMKTRRTLGTFRRKKEHRNKNMGKHNTFPLSS